MGILLEREKKGDLGSSDIMGKDRPGWGHLVNLSSGVLDEDAGNQDTWDTGGQCQVWEKIIKLSTLHSCAELKSFSRNCWVFAGLAGRQSYESYSLVLLLRYFRR